MSTNCKTVSLRTRKIKNGEQLSFYLDYYPGYRDESTMKTMRHSRTSPILRHGLFLYAEGNVRQAFVPRHLPQCRSGLLGKEPAPQGKGRIHQAGQA